MAEAHWSNTPRQGSCIVCSTSECDAGFVDLIGDTVVRGDGGDVVGVVDLIICANCIRMSARLVGCATPAEVDDLTRQKFEDDQRIENLEKELQSWQTRFHEVISFTKDDFDKIAADIGTRTADPAQPESSGPPPLAAPTK